MVKALIKAGKRVGIMAMSHAAIDNFLSETATVCEADPEADLRVETSHRTRNWTPERRHVHKQQL